MKTFLSILALSVAMAAVKAQGSVDFKIHMLPKTVYHQTMGQTYEIKFDFDSSSQAVLDKVDAQGGAALAPKTIATEMTSTITTGEPDNTGRIPVVMEILSSKMPGTMDSLAGTKVWGTVMPDSLPRFDSLVAPTESEAFKSTFLTIVNTMYSQMHYPRARIALGGSYTQTMPFSIPMGPAAMGMNISMTYTLHNMTGSIAHFTVAVALSMDVSGEGAPPMSGGGDGSGTLDYDTGANYITSMNVHYNMNIGLHKDDMVMHIHVKVGQSNTATISPLP